MGEDIKDFFAMYFVYLILAVLIAGAYNVVGFLLSFVGIDSGIVSVLVLVLFVTSWSLYVQR